jgi:hypothetical protein
MSMSSPQAPNTADQARSGCFADSRWRGSEAISDPVGE